MEYIYIILGGLGGGVVRGLIGYIKHQFSYKQVDFKLPYFFVMIFLSGIVGTLCATAINNTELINTAVTPAIAFLIGYAGGDLLDNLYKIIIKKKDAI
jgi:hypothetical protein